MERITAETFAAFNRKCEQERENKAEYLFDRAKDPNNSVAQCTYYARRAAALLKPRASRVLTDGKRVWLRGA